MSQSSQSYNKTDLANIVDDLIFMFLAMERVEMSLSSSTNKSGDVNDACLFAVSKLLSESKGINPQRFTMFVCKCKEMWTDPNTLNNI